jgi:uncharacterized protein YicC (UPF0701 family)
LRSVNGRFLDLGLRLPDEMRGLEPALRELVGAAFRAARSSCADHASRGRRRPGRRRPPRSWSSSPNCSNRCAGWLPQARELSVNEVLQWCRGAAPVERLDEAALDATRRCIEGLREARAREGDRLATMLLERAGRLRELARQAEPLLPQVVQRQQQRFLERWNEALGSAGAASAGLSPAGAAGARAARSRQLRHPHRRRRGTHPPELPPGRDRTPAAKAGGELGKRLDFLIQELQREANTLGSKSAALELTTCRWR